MPINFNPALYDSQLKQFISSSAVEGEAFFPYVDTKGNPTIGWGFAFNLDSQGVPRNETARDYFLDTVLGVNPERGNFALSPQGQAAETAYRNQLQFGTRQAPKDGQPGAARPPQPTQMLVVDEEKAST
jgi:hypothetical protein